MLAFAHLGDLHIVDAHQQNAIDLLAIIAQIELDCTKHLDFVVLPGDNADNGHSSQYDFIATALKMLSLPVHAITGDHDMEGGDLTAFRTHLSSEPLPRAVVVRGVRCLFLDISGPGQGGPDFRMGRDQLAWVEQELDEAARSGEPAVIFMHSYPSDIRDADEAERLTSLISRHDVALVDLGHTHYNEIANDGRTIYAATRSTGQIEEGPVGYSIATIDDGVVSWRFKTLADPFPFVMITSPADHRLLRSDEQIAAGEITVRARVFGRRSIKQVDVRVDDGEWVSMNAVAEDIWQVVIAAPPRPTWRLAVKATDETGRPAIHTIEPAGAGFAPRPYNPVGNDSNAIECWPENGLIGTQLGPNRNGRPLIKKA